MPRTQDLSRIAPEKPGSKKPKSQATSALGPSSARKTWHDAMAIAFGVIALALIN